MASAVFWRRPCDGIAIKNGEGILRVTKRDEQKAMSSRGGYGVGEEEEMKV